MLLLENPKQFTYNIETKGGMMCSKRYFTLPHSVNSIDEAYNYLNNTFWK